ncbi:DeoR/GlpR family DNA-binding transcription regulator [Actinopolyspora halophila]|uniref:DeoR/GlpR family DNA-binding transcription regulator n=1 Tax=Actinopolyspora halophila TaxID=1850 RepID=UPI000380FB84|nr:DeoR/GlpR family DNA-binding transcription regulator [Actinopolyspora halophila]
MYGAERRQLLTQRMRQEGRIDVATASEDLDVAPETIRRDLGALERQGFVRRVYGGAIPLERLDFEPEVAQRDTTASAEKDRIARAALERVPERGTLLLDAGTTTARLAGMLPAGEFTVVTNSLPVANQLAHRGNCDLHLLGGRVRATTLASVESWARDVLAGLTLDFGFLGANGFSAERGCTTPDSAEGAVKAAMVHACRQRVLLADHTKYGHDHFSRFAGISELDVLVTDGGLDQDAAEELRATGTDVVLA